MSTIVASNIQGIVVRGITHKHSVHLTFHAPNAKSAKQLISKLLDPPFGILSAEQWTVRPETILQISLTAQGLALLELSLTDFPDDFKKGPTRDPVITKWLGDVGESKSDIWWDNQLIFSEKVHGCIHAYANSETALTTLTQNILDLLDDVSVEEVFPWQNRRRIEAHWLPDDTIHFGYLDGISQPSVAWPWNPSGGSINPFYFLIGLNKPPEWAFISKPKNNPVTNWGTYLVLRVVEQNVPKFNKYLQTHGTQLEGTIAGSTQSGAEILAAKLVGRWRNGSPLILEPTNPRNETKEANNFDYSGDPQGNICPFSAHIRVTDARANSDLRAVSKPLRPLIRRGVPYGPQINPLDSTTDDGQERGLVGIFLCSNIKEQFEIVSLWMNKNSFRVYDNSDPNLKEYQDALMGSSQNAGKSPNIRIPVSASPGFVDIPLPDVFKTRGTLYLILPSIDGLRHLAGI